MGHEKSGVVRGSGAWESGSLGIRRRTETSKQVKTPAQDICPCCDGPEETGRRN